MQLCQHLVLIFQFKKIFEQRTLAPKFEYWFFPEGKNSRSSKLKWVKKLKGKTCSDFSREN